MTSGITLPFEPGPAYAPAAAERAAPARPPAWQERITHCLLRALSPRLKTVAPIAPPAHLAPFDEFTIARRADGGRLAATWYPAMGQARGAVLLAHPWLPVGQAYFHRRSRLEALRAAGYHALTFDFGGFGRSGPRPCRYFDLDLEAALDALAARAGRLPRHFWGVSFGGTWAHPLLTRDDRIDGAFFEDAPRHLIEWSKRTVPIGYPCYLFFQHGFPRAYRYFDALRHAPFLRVRAAAYAGAERDVGAPIKETRELARRARARLLVVPGARHLQSIKQAGDRILDLALDTFDRAAR